MTVRPKFAIGELVDVESDSYIEPFMMSVEVTDMVYATDIKTILGNPWTGWYYCIAGCGDSAGFTEICLSKIPPDKRLSWDELKDSLTEVEYNEG